MALLSLLRAQMPSGTDHSTALQEVRSPAIQSCWSCVYRGTGHSAGSREGETSQPIFGYPFCWAPEPYVVFVQLQSRPSEVCEHCVLNSAAFQT